MAMAFAAGRSATSSSRRTAKPAKASASRGLLKGTAALGLSLLVGGWMVGALATVQSVGSLKPAAFSYDLRASLDLKPLIAPAAAAASERALRIAKFSRLSAGADPKSVRLEGAHLAHLEARRPTDDSMKDTLAAALARAEADKQFAALADKRPSQDTLKTAMAQAMQDTVLVAPPTETAWDASPAGNAEGGEVEIADLQSPAEIAVANAVGPSEDDSLPMAGPLPITRPPANALALAIAPSAAKPAARAVVPEAENDDAPPALAFAKPENPLKSTARSVPWPDRGVKIAIYDITNGVVHMPSGEKLEAHSGIGKMRDNPKFTHVKMRGPTPPGTYKLSMREKPFHGVAAIRLTPTDGVAPLGRTGLLAHTYLLRSAPGDSHGCVAFANYPKFLKAYQRGEITHMIIVNRHDGSVPMAALRKINPNAAKSATQTADDSGPRRTLVDYLKGDS